MTTVRLRALLGTATLLGMARPASAQATPPLGRAAAFLAGCWERRTATSRVEEQWMAPLGGTMLGMGRTTRGDTVAEYEFLRIVAQGDTLVYAAIPSGQAPAQFRAIRVSGTELVFENPAHDFPQRVLYRRVGRDSLVARIEGTRDGQPRGIDFPFHRVRCGA